MGHAVKRQKMVFTHGIKGNVLGDDHFLVTFFEAYPEMFCGVFVHPAEDISVHLGDAPGSVDQPFTPGVFTNGFVYGNYSFSDR
jgi:hypothetical protein